MPCNMCNAEKWDQAQSPSWANSRQIHAAGYDWRCTLERIGKPAEPMFTYIQSQRGKAGGDGEDV